MRVACRRKAKAEPKLSFVLGILPVSETGLRVPGITLYFSFEMLGVLGLGEEWVVSG